MSPSRGTRGECVWSSCSVQSLSQSDLHCLEEDSHGKTEDLDIEAGVYPGEIWDANRQCQILLLDQNAHKDHTAQDYGEMCNSLKCRTSRRDGEYHSHINTVAQSRQHFTKYCSLHNFSNLMH